MKYEIVRINCKQMVIMPKKGGNIQFKSYESHPFCADFEIILVPQGNGKPNPE